MEWDGVAWGERESLTLGEKDVVTWFIFRSGGISSAASILNRNSLLGANNWDRVQSRGLGYKV